MSGQSQMAGGEIGELDATFERRRREWNVEGYRTAALTSIPLVLLSQVVEETLELPRPIERGALRMSCVCLVLVGLFLTERRRQRALAIIDWLMPLTYVWLAVLALRLMHLHGGYESPYFLALAFCIVGPPAVSLWKGKLFVAYQCVLYSLYLGPLALGLTPVRSMDSFVVRLYFIFGLTLIAAATQWMHNRMVRREVEAQVRLGNALGRIAGLKADRLNWLERLAGFLRHELKNQIVAVGTSLDLMEQTEAAGHPERYVGRARVGLGRMSRLVSSATEATSLEAALASETREAVDLSAVVTERMEAIRPALEDRPFVSEIAPELTLQGNEDRLAQMIDKLLENAAEHVGSDGEVRVALMNDNGHAVLTIDNEGDPLPADKEALFDAFVSIKKGKPKSTNLGLGLFVARVIAEAHGGRLNAEDLPDTRGARMVVSLPRGDVDRK